MVSRDELEFEERLLKDKQRKFIEIVYKASKALKVKPPKIKFWDGECSQGKPNELAHIHTDKNLVCISKRRLKQMTMEQIEQTATHEVTHLIEVSHNDEFYVTENNVRQKIWKPELVVVTDENKILVSKNKGSKNNDGCIVCSERAKLKKCKYCKNNFCEEHIPPKMALTPNVVFNEKDPVLARIYEGEYRKGGSHPCPPYGERRLNELKDKEKISMDKLMEALDKIKKDSKITDKLMEAIDKVKHPREEKPKEISPKFRISAKAAMIIIIIIIFGYVILTYNKEIMKFLPIYQNVSKECASNLTKAYESGASFGRDPFTYCKNTCAEKYNSTIYKVIEPNATYKMTACYCNVSSCKT